MIPPDESARAESDGEDQPTTDSLPGQPHAGQLDPDTDPVASARESTIAESPRRRSVPADLLDHSRYLILGVVGGGGMETVYKAQHRLMGRLVALKVLNQQLLARSSMVGRFRREVRAAASLSHPNIVHAYDAEQAGSTHFLVMEYVQGVDLERLVVARGAQPAIRAADFCRQVALGMQHAFERGMVHRGIKPQNLMLTPHGQVKILDFGLARYVSEQLLEASGDAGAREVQGQQGVISVDVEEMLLTAPTPVLPEGGSGKSHYIYAGAGTPDYMAPEEIITPRHADVRSDIYSLGCTLYRLLSGRVPFPGGDTDAKLKAHLHKKPRPLGDTPAKLAEVVERMMAKDPADRFQTPADVVQALNPFARPRRGHVLVVEDDGCSRAAMRAVLENSGYSVSEAADGREAQAQMRGGPAPDLVLLDLLMPGMDGMQFLQAQRDDPALAHVPVVIVSAVNPAQAQAAALGAADYLQKPIDLDQLPAVVESLEPLAHPAVPSASVGPASCEVPTPSRYGLKF